MGTLKFQAIEFRRDARWALGTEYTLLFTATGNLEIRRAASDALEWESGTSGDRLVMQEDGNLVIYSADGAPLWATNTSGNGNAVLLAHDDGSLEIVSEEGLVVWRPAPSGKPQPAMATSADAPSVAEIPRDEPDERDDQLSAEQ